LTGLTADKKQIRKTYMPVPYNMSFELSIFTKINDDMLQIIEQIIPYFQPAYTLSVNLLEQIGEKRDVPVVLEGISMSDDYEGNYTTRRALIYTLRFTAKTYIFGPITDPSKDIIKKVSIGLISGDQSSTSSREVVYSIEPRAIKNYTGQIATNLSTDIDNNINIINVDNAASINEKSYIVIDDEEMYVKSKSGNTLVVERGSDGTNATPHVKGSEIKTITTQDNSLIEFGDDFGFSGSL
jgi:hypothetical protein